MQAMDSGHGRLPASSPADVTAMHMPQLPASVSQDWGSKDNFRGIDPQLLDPSLGVYPYNSDILALRISGGMQHVDPALQHPTYETSDRPLIGLEPLQHQLQHQSVSAALPTARMIAQQQQQQQQQLHAQLQAAAAAQHQHLRIRPVRSFPEAHNPHHGLALEHARQSHSFPYMPGLARAALQGGMDSHVWDPRMRHGGTGGDPRLAYGDLAEQERLHPAAAACRLQPPGLQLQDPRFIMQQQDLGMHMNAARELGPDLHAHDLHCQVITCC